MSFNDDVKIDTSGVGSGGSGGAPGGAVVGGGIGGIILLIIALIFGINPSDLPTNPGGGSADQGSVQPGGTEDAAAFKDCKTGADANKSDECRVVATVQSLNVFWTNELKRYKREYTPAKTIVYNGSTQSACGTASNQVGPFYCPLDKQVYIDVSFFEILSTQFGSSSGPLAQEFVVAHEYGHHIQDALSAAASVGDDRIQEKTQGRVSPESWTHGSAEARQKWFTTGYTSGDLNSCDTFSPATVE